MRGYNKTTILFFDRLHPSTKPYRLKPEFPAIIYGAELEADRVLLNGFPTRRSDLRLAIRLLLIQTQSQRSP